MTIRSKMLSSRRSGAAMVEFAITLPILTLVLFGILEAGRAWHREQVLATASREGARVGAIYSLTYTADTARAAAYRMLVAGSIDTSKVTVQVLNPDLGGTNSTESDTVIITDTLQFPVLSRVTGGLLPVKRVVHAMTIMHNE